MKTDISAKLFWLVWLNALKDDDKLLKILDEQIEILTDQIKKKKQKEELAKEEEEERIKIEEEKERSRDTEMNYEYINNPEQFEIKCKSGYYGNEIKEAYISMEESEHFREDDIDDPGY